MLPYLSEHKRKIKGLVANIGVGVNNGYPPFDISKNESSTEKNLDSREYPVLHVREPRSNFATDLAGTQYGLYQRDNSEIIAVDGTAWKYWNGSAWVAIDTLTASAKASQVNFNGYTLLTNGTDALSWDGASTVATLTDLPSGVDRFAVMPDRVVGASSSDDVLYISALGTYDDWTTANDAGQIQMYTEYGEHNTGLYFYNDHVIYFKKHSMFELYGSIPSNFTPQMISNQIGCVSHRSIQEVLGYLFWLGEEGIYMYDGGTAPRLISYPNVDGTMESVDWANADDACAGTDGERYYICLPLTGSEYQVLTYDVRMRSWHLEDDAQFVDFVEFDGDLYGMLASGQIKQMVGSAGESISWEWVSKRFLNDYPSNKQTVRNVYVLLTLPTGSTMKCAVKTKEGTFTDVQTFTASSDIQLKQIRIPLTVAYNTDWYQIKFYGTGECTIHRFEIQSRIRGNTYSG